MKRKVKRPKVKPLPLKVKRPLKPQPPVTVKTLMFFFKEIRKTLDSLESMIVQSPELCSPSIRSLRFPNEACRSYSAVVMAGSDPTLK